MCRRNLFFSGILIAFGVGILLSLFIESALIRFLLGIGSIIGGFCLQRK